MGYLQGLAQQDTWKLSLVDAVRRTLQATRKGVPLLFLAPEEKKKKKTSHSLVIIHQKDVQPTQSQRMTLSPTTDVDQHHATLSQNIGTYFCSRLMCKRCLIFRMGVVTLFTTAKMTPALNPSSFLPKNLGPVLYVAVKVRGHL